MAKDSDKKTEIKTAADPGGSQRTETELSPPPRSIAESVGSDRKVGTALAHLQRLMEISGPLVVKLAHAAADTILHGEVPDELFDALEAMLTELGGGDHLVHAKAAREALE